VNATEFARLRRRLGRTQKQMSQLLGTSLTAVHSYEQGWRNVPGHVERQLLFLAAKKLYARNRPEPCWKQTSCPKERRLSCPAWEFRAGDTCWLINGTMCHGAVQTNWRKKMRICRKCPVLQQILDAKGSSDRPCS
jgi:DNA-binding XRE family transcriptional regulator